MNILSKHIKFILLIAGFIFSNPQFLVSDSDMPKGAEEWFYVVNYDAFKFNVLLYEYEKEIYLPFIETTSLLKIFSNYDGKYLTGFFINPDSTYKFDFDKLIIETPTKTIPFNQKDFIKSQLEIFVTPRILMELFGVSLVVQKSRLAIMLDCSTDLPVLQGYNRYRQQRKINSNQSEISYGPLLSDRNFSVINGGILDYNFQSELSDTKRNHSFNTNLKLELMGGDMQVRTFGNYNEEYHQFQYSNNYEWNYSIMDNNYISSIRAGHLTQNYFRGSSLLTGLDISYPMILGLQLTNESYRESSLFDNFVFNDKIGSNWQVELYKDNQLYSHTTADANGYYKMSVPIRYGTTNISLKYYGLFGEEMVNDFFYFIPNDFIPPGDIKYLISGGLAQGSKDKFIIDGRSSIGITSWMTSSFILQKKSDLRDFDYLTSTAISMGSGFQLNFGASSKKQYGAGLRYINYETGVYDLMFILDDNTNTSNPNRRYKVDFNGGLPRFDWMPLSLSLRASHEIHGALSSSIISSNLGFSIFGISFLSSYGINYIQDKIKGNGYTQNLNGSINFSWYDKPDWLSFIGQTFITINTTYDFEKNLIRFVNTSINQNIAESVFLSFSYNYDLFTKSNMFYTTLNISLQPFKFNSAARISEEQRQLSQQIQGSIEFEPKTFSMRFNNRPANSGSSGISSALIRLYLDDNLNGNLDEDEKIIPEVNFTLNGGSGGNVVPEIKGTSIKNLIPNVRYNLKVNIKSIKNPLWQPIYEEFSFISDPNVMKVIDIPCYTSSIVEGSVIRIIDTVKYGQYGVKVHFININGGQCFSIPVFKDGSFYSLSVMPGNYNVFVDSTQLSLLGVKSIPPNIEISIKSSEFGDYISDLNFKLINIDEEKQREYFSQNIANPENHQLSANEINTKNNTDIKINGNKLDSLKKIEINKNSISPPLTSDSLPLGVLNPLSFTKSKTTFLAPGMKRYLDRVADAMIANKDYQLRIEGHSENFGSMEENFNVSLKRSKEVVNYMVSKGIPLNRMISTAYGALRPIKESKIPSEKIKNNRVELTLFSFD